MDGYIDIDIDISCCIYMCIRRMRRKDVYMYEKDEWVNGTNDDIDDD